MRTQTLAALGEPSRLRIVELLRDGPRSVGEIAVALEIRQPQASKHLRVLSDAGVLSVEAVARKRIYRLDEARFQEMRDWIATFEHTWNTRLDALGDLLERSGDSSC